MPGCAAVGCNNRSEKGYIMKCFPRDPKLRKVWQERVARADWEPSNNSFLCHVHFKPQEWSITQSGRIRLKKNAVPSIFTVTSTRKSPKKRKKLTNIKKGDEQQDEYTIEYLDNDSEQSSTGNFEEHESDDQDIDETYQRLKKFSESTDVKENFRYVQDDNVIAVSDENMEKNNFTARFDINNRNINDVLSPNIKTEVKPEILDEHTFDDSYDEIEEKLKQICDGGLTNSKNCNVNKQTNSIVKIHKLSNHNIGTSNFNSVEHRLLLPKKVETKFPMKNEISYMLSDKQENVEIIFGTESGDDKSSFVPKKTAKFEKAPDCISNFSNITSVKEEGKFTEDIEENFSKDEVYVIPNMRAAMKRKRRTREEIMKSIKKSIGSASDQDPNLSNSDISYDTTDKDTEAAREIKASSPKEMPQVEKATFTIKVTGDPGDVTDVIQELSSKITKRHDLQESSLHDSKRNTFVTSVITIEEAVKQEDFKEAELSDHEILVLNDQLISDGRMSCSLGKISSTSLNLNEKQVANSELTLSFPQNQFTYLQRFNSDEDSKPVEFDVGFQNCIEDIDIQEYEELRRRAKVQEEVIEKLTNQLILYKNIESNLRSKNLALQAKNKEIETVSHKLSIKPANAQIYFSGKKNLESRQRLVEDLSSRVNYLEEMNKKLMKTVTLESQQKRKLEGQIKQRDNRIKELNWKLEKASKYLERAEKNTNTYRRKMLNMQTVMRRKKLLDDKMSRFSDILVDSTKEGYSEKTLATAFEIRRICGKDGYDKLLNYGLPLPPLRLLRKKYCTDDFMDYHESDGTGNRVTSRKRVLKREEIRGVKNETELDTKDSGVPESDAKETEFECGETITGTVQDIFDENNDGDDFSTNELKEHFILQLNTVM